MTQTIKIKKLKKNLIKIFNFILHRRQRLAMGFVITLVPLLWGSASSVYALETPRALAKDARIKVVPYEENNVVPIFGTPLINTQIIFGQDESIVNVQNGDSDAWHMDLDNHLANILNLKPTILGSKTNMDVVTLDRQGTRRYYRFRLTSPKTISDNARATYAIRFIYPKLQKLKQSTHVNLERLAKRSILDAPINPAHYNWDYSFHGATSIMPLHIFDDGKFTYMQLRPNQEVPAIFAVNNPAGKEAVVNFRRRGNYLVIQQIAPQFTLRDGVSHVASVFNNRLIDRLRYHGQ